MKMSGARIVLESLKREGVDVVFERSAPRRFDLVIGADGLHSVVRRLVFGPDSELIRHAGLYAATVALAHDGDAGREMFLLNAPGKLAAFHPGQDAPLAYFIFWHPEIPAFDHTDLDQHKGLLEQIEETPFLTMGFVVMLVVVAWAALRRLLQWLADDD